MPFSLLIISVCCSIISSISFTFASTDLSSSCNCVTLPTLSIFEEILAIKALYVDAFLDRFLYIVLYTSVEERIAFTYLFLSAGLKSAIPLLVLDNCVSVI